MFSTVRSRIIGFVVELEHSLGPLDAHLSVECRCFNVFGFVVELENSLGQCICVYVCVRVCDCVFMLLDALLFVC